MFAFVTGLVVSYRHRESRLLQASWMHDVHICTNVQSWICMCICTACKCICLCSRYSLYAFRKNVWYFGVERGRRIIIEAFGLKSLKINVCFVSLKCINILENTIIVFVLLILSNLARYNLKQTKESLKERKLNKGHSQAS